MPTPLTIPCPKCQTTMKRHCERRIPKNGGIPAPPCGWAICPKLGCHTVMRLADNRIMPTASEASK